MKEKMDQVLLVITSCPDKATAIHIAERLLAAKLAACVNIMPDVMSLYMWNGKQETAHEVLLQIKTTSNAYPALQACITENLPYEIPEIIALPVVAGLPAYLQWVNEQTGRQ
ncbi:divalent-cation tolerance protein CutA [Undibacterium sp. SXout20W]|uniref:divalent-cation tolerance protein CutA n=1 Tax=Undibacterium sp. SXout20W TaxID=3413051 RepID=UPI003BF0513F